jgi:hypothetical protein
MVVVNLREVISFEIAEDYTGMIADTDISQRIDGEVRSLPR